MPVRSGRRALPIVAAALLLGACGAGQPTAQPTAAPATASPVPSTAPSAGAPALLLEVTSEGGFINPSASIAALPEVVVDADGRIYTPAAPGSSTDPLVPPVDVRDTGASGAAQILAAIRTAGLDHEGDGGGIVADTGSTVFTVVIDGNTIVSRFARGGGGPGIPGVGGPGGPGGSGGDAPGAAAFDLLAQLTDPSVAWGSGAEVATAYVPVGFRLFDAPDDAAATGGTVAWPLSTGLAELGTPAVPDLGVNGLRSVILTGDAAVAAGPALAAASSETAFTSGGRTYRLWVRPLFPDELGG